ncbi:MAG: hypothetical protein IPK19_42120 [Chloroflexi bacterium]|nr:hypothetical protein [Chloroflexota bacterium]
MPLSWLDDVDAETLAQAPALGPDTFGTTPLEVLWGRPRERVRPRWRAGAGSGRDRTAGRGQDWIRRRPEITRRYGRTCLDGLWSGTTLRAPCSMRGGSPLSAG